MNLFQSSSARGQLKKLKEKQKKEAAEKDAVTEKAKGKKKKTNLQEICAKPIPTPSLQYSPNPNHQPLRNL